MYSCEVQVRRACKFFSSTPEDITEVSESIMPPFLAWYPWSAKSRSRPSLPSPATPIPHPYSIPVGWTEHLSFYGNPFEDFPWFPNCCLSSGAKQNHKVKDESPVEEGEEKGGGTTYTQITCKLRCIYRTNTAWTFACSHTHTHTQTFQKTKRKRDFIVSRSIQDSVEQIMVDF